MSNYDNLSDEHLNAFIDDQLDSDEKSRVFNAINGDKDLSDRACELRRLREMVRHAYAEPPMPPAGMAGMAHPSLLWNRALAAGLVLAIGVAVGWFGHAESSKHVLQATYLNTEKALLTTAVDHSQVVQEGKRVILHLSSAQPERLQVALDTAENLLKKYEAGNQQVELEIIANAGGLNLLRSDVSPYAQRVRDLQLQYENLTFLACKTAMNRLQQEQGIHVELLPEALIAPNALEQILTRLQQGWVYIKV